LLIQQFNVTELLCCTQKPLPLHQILRLVRCLKVILYKALREDPLLFSGENAKSDGPAASNAPSQGTAGALSASIFTGFGASRGSSAHANAGTEGSAVPSTTANSGTSSGAVDVTTSTATAERRAVCHALRAASAVLSDLYTRWARRPFSSAALWEVSVRTPDSVCERYRVDVYCGFCRI
jgi:hypothetical protein